MNESIQQKQQFLRIEILEAGYDPQDFIQYMNTNSTIESPSIQTLTLTQLQKIVAAYRQQVRRRNLLAQQQYRRSKFQNLPEQKVNNGQPQGQGQKYHIQQKKIKIQYDRFGTFDYQYKGAVACIETQKIIKQIKLQISVPEIQTKQVQGYIFGIGAKTQYYYHIKTNLMKGTVKRLSQDFDWLNNTLLRLYPYLLLPELQPLRKDLKDPYAKRQKQIQQYLQHLGEKKVIVNSYVFIDFLTISLEKVQKYKKSYDSMGFAKGVSLLKMQQGYVQVQISNKSRQLYAASKQFSKKTAIIHENLTLAFNKMLQSYKVAITDTYCVVDLFAELHDIFNQLNNKSPALKKTQYMDMLVNLNNLFLGVGDNLKHISDTIQKHTNDYFRFYNSLDRNLQKLQKQIKDAQIQYLQFKNTLQKKKQRVISDPTKWDLDNRQIDTKKLSKEQIMKLILPKQVLAQSQLKAWYGFNLKNYENQFVCYLEFVTKRYQKVFKQLAVQLLADDKLYLQVITNFISENRKAKGNTIIEQWSPDKIKI